jgi:hypothetical protein
MVRFHLPTPAKNNQTWFKYSSAIGWKDYSANASFNSARDQVTLTLVDGGSGDDDGVANMIIVDPSGIGTSLASTSSSGDGGGGGCFIAAATDG